MKPLHIGAYPLYLGTLAMRPANLLMVVMIIFSCSVAALANAPLAVFMGRQRIVAPVALKQGAIQGEGQSIQAKIVIPRKLMNSLAISVQADVDGVRTKRLTPPPPPALPAPDARSGAPSLRTIVAGLAMSLAAVSLVFVLRGGNRTTRNVGLAVLSGALVLSGLGIAQADLPAPNRRNTPPVENKNEIVIELTDEGDSVTLYLAR